MPYLCTFWILYSREKYILAIGIAINVVWQSIGIGSCGRKNHVDKMWASLFLLWFSYVLFVEQFHMDYSSLFRIPVCASSHSEE